MQKRQISDSGVILPEQMDTCVDVCVCIYVYVFLPHSVHMHTPHTRDCIVTAVSVDESKLSSAADIWSLNPNLVSDDWLCEVGRRCSLHHTISSSEK
jgi:hypothetical protein